jgi:large subunit ribosomal protein L24
MNLKKGDKVKILAGKDKGKTGKVLQVFTEENKASIEGINLLIKHMRPKRQGDKGQRIEFPAPMDVSKVMVMCTKCGKPTRIAHKYMATGDKKKKYRMCKKCQQIID